ncbi:P-loop containing nucleoside triphosphate hydrolase protein [Xylaria cf. heliscus]|nr:P-loop containing nucleoside triphosphate hydrolase protein [Xylaria cf. heliscus]
MSLINLPIIYLTGATACGKGTLGKMLAFNFRLYHISMGDLRRSHLDALRIGVPWMSEPIRQHIRDGEIVPRELTNPYEAMPAVLLYHNDRVSGRRSWSTETASAMLREEMVRMSALAQSEENLVQEYRNIYAGLTIVMETPIEVARQRYLERARMPSENEARFDRRMESTLIALPGFIDLMANYGEIVRSTNDDTMSVDEAYETLIENLNQSNTWLTFTGQN